MTLFIRRIFIYLFIALLISFVLIPAYEIFVSDKPFDFVMQHTKANLNFETFEIWKRVFIFYLALWCGKAILWALATASMKPRG